MARKEAPEGKRSSLAVTDEVFDLIKKIISLTGELLEVKDYVNPPKDSEGWKLWDAIEECLEALHFLPTPKRTVLSRLIRAEGASFVCRCEVAETMFKSPSDFNEAQLKIQLIELHATAVRLGVLIE
jgi:hypothetical protein